MSPRKNAQVAFAAAVVVLLLSAVSAYITILRLRQSASRVVHTYQVEAALGELDSSLSSISRAHTAYSITGGEVLLQVFDTSLPVVHQKLREVRMLTGDSPRQQALCTRLEDLTERRIGLFQDSIALKKSAPLDDQGQIALTDESLTLAFQEASVIAQMRQEEQRLLNVRTSNSNRLYMLTVVILAVTFALAIVLFFIHYKLLGSELRARELAESAARESEASLRSLTSRLLQVQDEERRKFSRELHDSLGQYLAGVKMNLEMFSQTNPPDELLTGAIQILDQSIAETRTISHLLHPPLLDEVGFASAAKWYVEGFSQRSGVNVELNMPDDLGRLPKDLELGLFRVLQEGLTNIHRHSKSTKAEVTLRASPENVVLQIRDYGKGIPEELLSAFQTKGMSSGVGLTGMRERVRELGGQLDVQSDSSGTLISMTLERRSGRLKAGHELSTHDTP